MEEAKESGKEIKQSDESKPNKRCHKYRQSQSQLEHYSSAKEKKKTSNQNQALIDHPKRDQGAANEIPKENVCSTNK